ncbi:MAG TPA: zinc-ribbon domain-containing protein [Chloroflexi bacterium]|nr:zinc-ribbon domain-containing protein [Chloroflexota bacterium]
MDIGSIFLILALALLVVLYITRPFVEHKATLTAETEQEISSLLAQRESIIRTLEELDFDHTLGKIPEEDYPQQRQLLLQRGAEVLRRLDELQRDAQTPAAAEDRLEAAIAARRAARRGAPAAGKPASPPPDDPLEAAIAARKRQRQEKAAGFCPQCGAPLQRSDKFCPRCGTPVKN